MSLPEENEYEGYNSEVVRYEWWIDTGYVGADHRDVWIFEPGELPDDPSERASLLDEMLDTEMANVINAGYRILWEDE